MILPVQLPQTPYSLYLNETDSFQDIFNARFPARTGCVIITNTTIARYWAEVIKTWEHSTGAKTYTIGDGESFKTIQTVMAILDFLIASRYDRKSVLIALGGGVVGDISGFAASIFMRGIAYVQVPTTLLAMADSSVGGKTGINHPAGKNLIGSFHQPAFVWMDTAFLSTLQIRQFTAGSGELFKCAFIGGRDLFEYIATHADDCATFKEPALQECIYRCVALKAAIVTKDEKETGLRILLNFGHTFAHALEQFFHYENILHGEAVLWGIVGAYTYAKLCGLIAECDVADFDSLIQRLSLPPLPSAVDCEKLYGTMFSDKKNHGGKLRLILPTRPGSAIIYDTVEKNIMMATLQTVFSSQIPGK